MAMTACYPNYDMSLPNSQSMSHHLQSHHISAMQSNRTGNLLAVHQQSQQSPQTRQPPQKDYSIPLHVDCSVEYELPNQAKPPVGARVEPLLMIHPCYFRKMESQRRSPFINNMPNSTSRGTNSQSVVTAASSTSTSSTTHMSSSRRSNTLALQSNSHAVSSSAKNQSNAHLMSNSNAISNQQNHIQQQQQQQPHMSHHSQNLQQNHHQNLQTQIDEYVQRQMVHISQQAQYPMVQQPQQHQLQQQSNSQYNIQAQHQHQMQPSGNWDRYLNVANNSMLGKVNIPNQNAYKKSGKRHLTATCANSFSASHLEGSLPNGITRWDEKTVMAAIPRDYQSGPESIPSSIQQQQQHQHHQTTKESITPSTGNGNLYRGASSQQSVLMSGKRDRDPMLSGGCIYNNSNNSNNNLNTDISNLASSGLWEPIQKSPMAAIPNNNYQAGPDSIPNNNHSSNSNNNNKTNSNNGLTHRQPAGTTSVIHHSQYPQHQQQQQHIHQNDKPLSHNVNVNNSNVITVKYRQYRNSHRMHPYMMNNMSAPSVNNTLSSVSSYFPQINGPFPHIQQVSCYNV